MADLQRVLDWARLAAMRRVTLAPFVLLLAVACGGEEPTSAAWTPIAEPTAAQRAQLERAAAAKDALGGTLLGELTTALQDGDAAKAIAVCQRRAPAIAQEVAAAQQVRIGRTSARLRNEQNAAPAWARAHVDGTSAEPARFAGPGGELGALFPIRLMPQCALCHGPAEDLAPAVTKALGEHYPQDRATGFRPGELRGWFWVEVPKAD